MNTTTSDPTTLFDEDVFDSSGNKIGSVDGVWIDDATNELEFISVKTGWLLGKSHIIPAQSAQFSADSIQVPYSEDQIKDAPSYSADEEISPDEEQEIYSFYGLDRSTAPSPSGLATGTTGYDTTDTSGLGTSTEYGTSDASADLGSSRTGTFDTAGTESDQINVPLSEEEIQVGKRSVEAGRVRLRKVVRTENVEVPVELRREDVEIERVDASGATVPDNAFEEGTVEVPVMEEQPVVSKEARVTGQVNLNKTVETETRDVGGQVRREDVEVDDDTETVGRGEFARSSDTTTDTTI